MVSLFRTHSVIIAHDVTNVVCLVKPVIRDWLCISRISNITEDYVLDAWFSYTIHQFEIVSVIESHFNYFAGELAELNKITHDAASALWHTIDIPVELSGSLVTTKRIRDLLFMVYLDPEHIKSIGPLAANQYKGLT